MQGNHDKAGGGKQKRAPLQGFDALTIENKGKNNGEEDLRLRNQRCEGWRYMAIQSGEDQAELPKANEKPIHELVYTQVERFQGSISAEHGVGQLKLDGLRAHKGEVAHELMKSLKRALDPQNILNPGKVVLI